MTTVKTNGTAKIKSGRVTHWVPFALRPLPNLEYFNDQDDACVYFLIDGYSVAYVGSTKCLPARIRSHRRDKKQFSHVVYLKCKTKEMLQTERAFIAYYKPALNLVGLRNITSVDARALTVAGLKNFKSRFDTELKRLGQKNG